MENWTGNPFDDTDAVSKLGGLPRRSTEYEEWLLHELKSRGCKKVLDVACGTGVDSIFLIDHGFEVVSCDDAEAMLQVARDERVQRQNKSQFRNWDIRRANWMTLQEDLPGCDDFDAVLCLGSSLFHMIDSLPELPLYRQCLNNFKRIMKPGGLLMIDHRNMDSMIDRGFPVNKNVYHKVEEMKSISTNLIEKDGEPSLVEITYGMILDNSEDPNPSATDIPEEEVPVTMALTPLRMLKFVDLLKEIFGENCKHSVFGDLEPFKGETEISYFQHCVECVV